MGLFKSKPAPAAPPPMPALQRPDLSKAVALIEPNDAALQSAQWEYLDAHLSPSDSVLAAATLLLTFVDAARVDGAVVLCPARMIVVTSPRDERLNRSTGQTSVEVIELGEVRSIGKRVGTGKWVGMPIVMKDGNTYDRLNVGPTQSWGQWFIDYATQLVNQAKLA